MRVVAVLCHAVELFCRKELLNYDSALDEKLPGLEEAVPVLCLAEECQSFADDLFTQPQYFFFSDDVVLSFAFATASAKRRY